jgi:hypothetical protein
VIDRVHHVLGRHRDDDPRRGWISGLSETDGEAHPTLGGLRIGKPLPERRAGEPPDDRLEWERDGQYFHYLTKWMHALAQTTRATGDARFATWARELADTAHRRFVHGTPGAYRMSWKLSIDLMRPQVSSMGHHDPLDGYITCLELDAATVGGPDLSRAKDDFLSMIEPSGLATADPLGIGGLLIDGSRLVQLDRDQPLARAILAAARRGLEHYLGQLELRRPAEQRLAFATQSLIESHPQTRRSGGSSAWAEIASFWAIGARRSLYHELDQRHAATTSHGSSVSPRNSVNGREPDRGHNASSPCAAPSAVLPAASARGSRERRPRINRCAP